MWKYVLDDSTVDVYGWWLIIVLPFQIRNDSQSVGTKFLFIFIVRVN